MFRAVLAFTMYLVVATALSANGLAQNRDSGLEAVRVLTTDVIQKTGGTGSDRDVFVGVQALTDALRRFVLAETELRAEEPVGPPRDASLRPGQAEGDGLGTPGEEQSLSDVPTDWFNLYANQALDALDNVRDGVEGGADRNALTGELRRIESALNDINRPPAT